jgi:hypothetical protein
VSETPRESDDAMKLLDAGWNILLFKNQMGSYTGVAMKDGQGPMEALQIDGQTTDDFMPSQVLYRLTEKVIHKRIV